MGKITVPKSEYDRLNGFDMARQLTMLQFVEDVDPKIMSPWELSENAKLCVSGAIPQNNPYRNTEMFWARSLAGRYSLYGVIVVELNRRYMGAAKGWLESDRLWKFPLKAEI